MKKEFKYKKLILGLIPIFILNGFITPIPKETSFEGIDRNAQNIEFLYDLTYKKDGNSVKEQSIFKEQLKLIEEAEKFIIADMFLFNDDYNRKFKVEYPNISEQLTDALIKKKNSNPKIKIIFITDEINNFYGVYESHYIKRLKENDIDVVITDLGKLRDSNPIYSGVWRSLIKWFGTSGKGWLPNSFRPDSSKVTLRGYLKLLNFKANHRKVIISEKNAIVSSMNPHDASGYHSNIGFKMNGDIILDLISSELEIAKLSGYKGEDDFKISHNLNVEEINSTTIALITESKIRDNLIKEIKNTKKGNKIMIGMFYLSHRDIIKELINAAERGVDVKLVLDPNKDAFGIEKNGIPNRQVAYEMKKRSNNSIEVKWYGTHGEQYHTKMVIIEKENQAIIIGGSANLTRRNLDDYNLEANVMVKTLKDTKLYEDIKGYFNRIWTNEDGDYTIEYENYREDSFMKTLIYRFQEWSGLSTF
ncbi:phospholipase D family protein [Tissierella praeacuta]|uniref:phospholipase D family protein n=1 Tax=Tissierella praeacuta TaxID=43131 RepID=UPI001C0F9705|nr:phospholipase D family protein [Tissierella praeacuta]MBU5255946.1 phospholipase D family protein [Tissierella praeacuta]